MLISATALLERNPSPSDGEIRRAIQGNICRCTGYVNIVRAIRSVAGGEAAR
jgi:carbon-monoxide dehydrogenase small subunit